MRLVCLLKPPNQIRAELLELNHARQQSTPERPDEEAGDLKTLAKTAAFRTLRLDVEDVNHA